MIESIINNVVAYARRYFEPSNDTSYLWISHHLYHQHQLKSFIFFVDCFHPHIFSIILIFSNLIGLPLLISHNVPIDVHSTIPYPNCIQCRGLTKHYLIVSLLVCTQNTLTLWLKTYYIFLHTYLKKTISWNDLVTQ